MSYKCNAAGCFLQEDPQGFLHRIHPQESVRQDPKEGLESQTRRRCSLKPYIYSFSDSHTVVKEKKKCNSGNTIHETATEGARSPAETCCQKRF